MVAVIDILKAFALNTLSGGKRFAHCRRLQDDSAVAKITGMHKGRLCGEDAAIGYNPQKPGRPSHHPLACVIGGTRLCLHMEWRKGNTVSSSRSTVWSVRRKSRQGQHPRAPSAREG